MKFALSRLLVAACAAALASLPVARAQAPAAPAVASVQAATFKKEELDQLVAPIALYPDALIAQILMAATFPSRWYTPRAGRRRIRR